MVALLMELSLSLSPPPRLSQTHPARGSFSMPFVPHTHQTGAATRCPR